MKISKNFSSIILIVCVLCYLVESESIIHQIYGIKRTDGVVLKQLTSELKSFILLQSRARSKLQINRNLTINSEYYFIVSFK